MVDLNQVRFQTKALKPLECELRSPLSVLVCDVR